MPERLHSIVITVAVDTTKTTTGATYELGDEETVDELMARVTADVHDTLSAIA